MKFILSCTTLVICMYAGLARNVKSNKDVLRIMGGRNASEDEFPYVVKLMLHSLATRHFLCSSVVLTSKWTLTAGHCVMVMEHQFAKEQQTKAVIEYQSSPKGTVAYSEVLNSTLHPSFTIFGMEKNDIGLLHTQPVLFPKYGKLSSIDFTTLNGQEVALVGYGIMQTAPEDPPHVPQVLDVMAKLCTSAFHYPQLCFARSCSKNVRDFMALCPGDSGGPAVHASGVVSINTMTDPRDCRYYPGPSFRRDRYDTGYNVGSATPVSPFIDWVYNVINT